MEDFANYDEDAMMKDLEKEAKKNSKNKKNGDDISLNAEDKAKLQQAVHDKLMLTGNDGEIHTVAEIDFIIKDVLKHQHVAFKRKREIESAKENVEGGDDEVNDTFTEKCFSLADGAALAYTNDEVVQHQRGALFYFAKKIGVNLLTGKSIMNISLPIKIFEPRSMLEKIASDFRYTPYYLNKAMEEPGVVERMRIMTIWYIGSLQLEPQMLKPFNPILGETFQGVIGEYEIIGEQISHHPPISAFQMWSDTIENSPTMEGYLAHEAGTGLSTITGAKTGYIRFHFPDIDQKITFTTFPEGEMHGVMKGIRTYDYVKQLKAHDEENKLYLDLVFDPDKKGWFKRMFTSSQKTTHDYYEGIISDNPDFDYKDQRDSLDKMIKKDEINVYSRIEGVWTENMKMDDQIVWEYPKYKPQKLHYINNPLPSDCRFRTDLIALLNNDLTKAQEQKDVLEDNQRNDRKLRKEHAKD